MHNLIDTSVTLIGVSRRWQSLPESTLNTLTVKDALTHYRKFYIKIQAGTAPAFWADLKQVVAHESINTQVLKTWLSTQTKYNFNAIDEPSIKHKTASYSIASKSGYMVRTWDKLYSDNNPEPTRKDLLMTREVVNTNYIDYHNYCLTSVGGLFHYTDVQMSGDKAIGVIIEDGMSTIRGSNVPTIGIWSFSKICALNKYKITSDMVSKLTQDDPDNYDITKSLILTLPEAAVGKYIMLVIAGHLCFAETQVFSHYNEQKLLLNLNVDQAMIDRYYCASSILNMQSVNNVVKNAQADVYANKQNLLSEQGLIAMLTMPQSFIVAFDNPEMYMQIGETVRGVSRVLYTTPNKPESPIMGLQGYCPEYWASEEKFGYSLRLSGPQKYIIENKPDDLAVGTYSESISIDSGKIDYDSHLFRQDKYHMQMLEIGSDRVV